MKTFILTLFTLLILSVSFAQQAGRISGSVTHNDSPVDGATVSLLKAKDSAIVKLSVADKKGGYLFENIKPGKYVIAVTAAGFRKAFSKPIEVTAPQPEIAIAAIALVQTSKGLTEVTVTAKKALVEHHTDRTIVNVDASITNIGTSALEVLEKSPGITVDSDGNISLKGKSGVMIMVDGRPTQLSGPDLVNLLRGLHSNQLDQIEIMTNPPARYDASGTSGVINIKTKKIIRAGINGSASVTYTQGRYPKIAEAFNFNYRQGKVNLFSNLSHNYNKRFSILSLDRNIYNSATNSLEKVFNQEVNRAITTSAYNAKVGVDFFASPKTTLGAVVNLNWRNMTSDNPNVTKIYNASKVYEGVTNAAVNNGGDWESISTNLNFRHILDKKGKEITSDLDYVKHTSVGDLFMVNSYMDAASNPLRKADTVMGALPQDINVYSARVDYLHPMKKNARFEAGLKSSIVRTDNNAVYDSIQYGNVVHDFNRSNHFIYEENINAAYANFNTPLSKKISAQLGLRLENTIAKGNQRTTGETFNRSYTQLFPTAYFQYKLNDKNNLGVNIGRRVSRPSYQSLNPFIRFLDRYTFSQGNPELRPSVSNNIELSHSWKNKIITTINYSHITDIIESIIQQRGLEAYNQPANVASQQQFGIAVSANTPVNKWWQSSINVNAFHDKFKGIVNNTPINISGTTLILNIVEQFKLSKTLSAEINGWYRAGGLEGAMVVRALGRVGAGISKQVLKNKGIIRLTARDIFWTQRQRANTRYGNVDVAMRQVSETQVVALGFTYNFSRGKKIAPVKRTSGSANEEQGRID